MANRHERRKAQSVGVGPVAAITNEVTPFEPIPPLKELDRDARKLFVALLYNLAGAYQKDGVGCEFSQRKFAASIYTLMRAGLVSLVSDGGRYGLRVPKGMKIDWMN